MFTATQTGPNGFTVNITNLRAIEARTLISDAVDTLEIAHNVGYVPTDTSKFVRKDPNPVGQHSSPQENETRALLKLVKTAPTGVIREWRVGGRALSGVTISRDGRIAWLAYDAEAMSFISATIIPDIQQHTIRKAANGRRGDAVYGRKVKR